LNQVGLIGLGVMGENLAINIASHGYSVSVYNRTAERTREFAEKKPKDLAITPTYTIEELVKSLERPRRIILMIKAGKPVDYMLSQLTPHLDEGDVVFDCGNSFFRDTERRQEELAKQGLTLMGVGISGGEEGALKGPSIMVGGDVRGYELSAEMWREIAAKADGEACADYMGKAGAGHFVKMTHNGIEYAILQLIAETYDVMHIGMGMTVEEIKQIFNEWNRGELSSYLLDITVEVLDRVDEDTGKPLVEVILDKAEQKGTGKWTSQTALDLGIPTPSIDAAVEARIISGLKNMRETSSKLYGCMKEAKLSRELLRPLYEAFYLGVITAYAQGLHLIKQASEELGYGTDLTRVVKVWRNGCIIRSKLLGSILKTIQENPEADNILLTSNFAEVVKNLENGMRELLSILKKTDIPTPVMDSTLNYLISIRREKLPANIIQALRDRFGSHGYERIDKPGRFHTKW